MLGFEVGVSPASEGKTEARQVTPFFSGEIHYVTGTYTWLISAPRIWMRLTLHSVPRRSHCPMGKYVKGSSRGTFFWEEGSVWKKLDVRLGESDIKLRRHLRTRAWQLAEHTLLMVVGAFWNKALIMVPFQWALGHLVFLHAWYFKGASVWALKCLFFFWSHKRKVFTCSVLFYLKLSCGGDGSTSLDSRDQPVPNPVS